MHLRVTRRDQSAAEGRWLGCRREASCGPKQVASNISAPYLEDYIVLRRGRGVASIWSDGRGPTAERRASTVFLLGELESTHLSLFDVQRQVGAVATKASLRTEAWQAPGQSRGIDSWFGRGSTKSVITAVGGSPAARRPKTLQTDDGLVSVSVSFRPVKPHTRAAQSRLDLEPLDCRCKIPHDLRRFFLLTAKHLPLPSAVAESPQPWVRPAGSNIRAIASTAATRVTSCLDPSRPIMVCAVVNADRARG